MNVPADLCEVHRQHARDWLDNVVDLRDAADWPGGATSGRGPRVRMDSRTGPDEQVREFERKNREQVDLIIRICRSGRSPQCERVEAGEADQLVLLSDVEPHPRCLVPMPAQDAARDVVTRQPAEVYL